MIFVKLKKHAENIRGRQVKKFDLSLGDICFYNGYLIFLLSRLRICELMKTKNIETSIFISLTISKSKYLLLEVLVYK